MPSKFAVVSRLTGSGALSLLLGASLLALLESILLRPIQYQPLAEQMVLVLLGAMLVAAVPFLLLVLMPANSLVAKVFGPADSDLRQGRCFAFGFLLVSPPMWLALQQRLLHIPVSPYAVALVIPVLLLPFVLRSFWMRPTILRLLRYGGLVGWIVGLVALWSGPLANWREQSSISNPTLRDLSAAPGLVASEATPDIVLISIDTLRADAIVGETSANVPFMDQLRAGGAWTPWALSSSNRTGPGHAAMLTGLGALWHGVTNNNQTLPESHQAVAETFRAGGYRTMGLVNNALLRTGSGFDQGHSDFDDKAVLKSSRVQVFARASRGSTLLGWILPAHLMKRLVVRGLFARPHPFKAVPVAESSGGVATARAKVLLDLAYQEERPFFFFLHYIDPHHPYTAPLGFWGTREGEDEYDRYLEEVEFMDHCLKQVVERLQRSGRPFLLCLTSDHGEHFHEHGLTGHSNSLFNELLQVPLIFYGDGVPAGEILENSALKDVAPTLLGRCGLSFEGMRGRDLLAQPQWDPGSEYLQFARDVKYYGAFSGPYKWVSPKGWVRGSELAGEVYLWQDDPHELTPLDIEELPAAHQQRIMQGLQDAPEIEAQRFTGAEASRQMAILRQMGYLEDAELPPPPPLPDEDDGDEERP